MFDTDGYGCYQNVLAERVNGVLKGEYLLRKPAHPVQAAIKIDELVHLYNTRRPHAALKYNTPDEVQPEIVSTDVRTRQG